MKPFRIYQDTRLPDSDIHLLESEELSVTWGYFSIEHIFNLKKYPDDSDEEQVSINKNNKHFLSHFCLTGATESYFYSEKFSIKSAEHSFFSLRDNSSIDLHIIPTQNKIQSFFEFFFSKDYFEKHFPEDSPILTQLSA